MRKTRRFILLMAIIISLGAVAYKVTDTVQGMKQEIEKNPLKVLDYLPESALQMKDFHRAKIEDGRKVWELFGDEAQYFKDQKEAVIKKPRFLYYDKKGEASETSGDEARIYLNEKELEKLVLRGSIRVNFQGFVLQSEEASYLPAKDQIVLPNRTKVVGDGLELEGASMEVELETKKIRLVNNVKTKLEPDKLSKKKAKTGATPRIEG
ncbi:MAG TPA: LPS export ABC transporter periplasmic protein LptC [Candidatus Limnocylindria bacterium]|nr:LPS export ABC transporter periplasmic protein LptC [Candidatus Limnocylindria bacterium]